MNQATRSFYAGALWTGAVVSILQDCMGKEQYILHVQDNWAPAYLTVPLSLCMIVVAMWLDSGSRE